MKKQSVLNFIGTCQVIAGNMTDDPSYFALQVARRFKTATMVGKLTRILGNPGFGLRTNAIAAMLRDDRELLKRLCKGWIGECGTGRESVLLGNLCIAAGEWEYAEKLLGTENSSQNSRRALARLQWSLGNMSRAINILESMNPGRQLRHYKSELAVLTGLEPRLRKAEAGKNWRSPRKTVLYLATNSLPHTGSGYAQRTQSILSALIELNWTVKAATRVTYPINVGKLTSKMVDTVGAVEYERFIPFPAKQDFAGRIQQQAEAILRKVQSDQPQILHTTTDFSNALAVKAVSESTGIPWVYEVRGQLADTWLSIRPSSAAESERYKLFIEREAYVARNAHHVFTLGEQMKTNLINAGVEPSKISLLPNGVGDQFLDEPVQQFDARKSLGLDAAAFYVGTVSSIVPYEGLETVVRAVAAVSKNHPQLKLLIVGDGTERENLLRLADELGISKQCEFPGRVSREESHLYHASLNAFVVPRKDSLVTRAVTPLKPVEAMASAVPVLASDLPALAELVVDDENGNLIVAEDVQAWASAISRAVSNPEKYVEMGKSGRKFVMENRTWKQDAQKLNDVYNRVINLAE